MKSLKNIGMSAWIKKYEGFSAYPTLDNSGKVKIGFGRCIDDIGISDVEAEFLFKNDLCRCIGELKAKDWFMEQPIGVQMALINMNFNLGIAKLDKFQRMIVALKNKDYNEAAKECLASKWADDNQERAKDVALMIREADAVAA